MTVKLTHYRVLVADPDHIDDPTQGTEHEVYIVHGDQMRAELEGPRNGIPSMDVAPFHGIALWIWAALCRTHVIDQPFQEFLPRLLGFDDLDEEDKTKPAPIGVGPTQPSLPAAGPSSWPASSADSNAGSTPMPTPA